MASLQLLRIQNALNQLGLTTRDMLAELTELALSDDLRGKLDVRDSVKVEIVGLYWHFVDVVWIVIFTVVYLIP